MNVEGAAKAVEAPSKEAVEAAEKCKEEANAQFKGSQCALMACRGDRLTCRPLALHSAKHYALAILGYTKAIERNPTVAVYYANRAFTHIKVRVVDDFCCSSC